MDGTPHGKAPAGFSILAGVPLAPHARRAVTASRHRVAQMRMLLKEPAATNPIAQGTLSSRILVSGSEWMIIKAGFHISFECVAPTPILLMLNVHPSREQDLVTKDDIRLSPSTSARSYLDTFSNRVTRCTLPAGLTDISCDFLIRDSGAPDEQAPDARQMMIEELPDDVLLFLVASRYCDSDHFLDLAWKLFGTSKPGWDRVMAICDYVHDRLEFGYQHACATRTASSGHDEKVGVCRDFAHLAIALCRAMNIPARYATGYLGDIGVPADPAPMDFSAWFEAYLGGTWYTFDARHNTPRIGRVVMARGRDAADCALTTSFGKTTLVNFTVFTDLAEDQ